MENIDRVVLLLIAANVIFSMRGFSNASFFEKYKFNIGKIKAGEKIRMVSSGFLHVDWMHLIFNMYALYLFGDIVAKILGTPLFLVIYVASLLVGNLYTLQSYKNQLYYSAVGASGAVSGIIFSSILLYPEMDLFLFFIPIPIPGYIFGVGYLIYSIYGMKNQNSNIGHSAHLGGAVAGFALTLLLEPSLFSENKLTVILMAIPILVLLFFGDKIFKK
ncbi:rhomboid family intramembrane serine protease [Polaribacter sp.]|nr:rhomboid family intramembrane serine protease [Polaribacter sp.]